MIDLIVRLFGICYNMTKKDGNKEQLSGYFERDKLGIKNTILSNKSDEK